MQSYTSKTEVFLLLQNLLEWSLKITLRDAKQTASNRLGKFSHLQSGCCRVLCSFLKSAVVHSHSTTPCFHNTHAHARACEHTRTHIYTHTHTQDRCILKQCLGIATTEIIRGISNLDSMPSKNWAGRAQSKEKSLCLPHTSLCSPL